MDKICVIVPIYNVEKYIEKCIISLQNQTYKNIEIYAISDGSPDHSMDIVNRLAKRDNRIISIEKENGGYGSVLRYAISKTKSEFFLVCDPDDWLEPSAIEELYKNMNEFNTDIVIGDYYKIYNDKDAKVRNFGVHHNFPIIPYKKYDNLDNFYFFCPTPHAKLFKTKIAKKLKFPNKVSYTDTILFDIYLAYSNSAVYINVPLANYFFDRPGNTSEAMKKYNQKTYNSVITVLKSMIEQLDKISNVSIYSYYRVYCELISTLSKIGKIEDKEQINKDKKELNKILKLINNKRNLYVCINDKNIFIRILKKIIYKFIFNKYTNKIFIDLFVKLNSKR